jgi:hypothetical protein
MALAPAVTSTGASAMRVEAVEPYAPNESRLRNNSMKCVSTVTSSALQAVS